MAITKVTLAKEHDDGVEYLYPKTSSDIVSHNDKQGNETNLQSFLSDIKNIPGTLDIENGGTGAITASNAIYNLTDGKIEIGDNTVNINANANISGTTTSEDKLIVENNGADINGKLTITGGDIETDNNIKGSTIQSVNSTTVGDKLIVTSGGVDITGDSKVTGNLTITGTTDFSQQVTMKALNINNGDLTVSGYIKADDCIGGSIPHGICNTSGSTKNVTVSNAFSFKKGSMVLIQFALDENITDGFSLNVNNTGSKPVTYKGTQFTGNILKNMPYLFIIGENNSSYEMINNPASINNIYESIPYGECEDTGNTRNVTIKNGEFTLQEGAMVIVEFKNNINAISSGEPYMNVNNTGNKFIRHGGALFKDAIIKDIPYIFIVSEDCSSYEMINNPADINQSSSTTINNIYESIPYGICEDTGRSKTVTITNGDFTLLEGAMLIVRFTNNEDDISGGVITLNVNNTGNKPITYKNASFSDAIIKDIPYIFIVSKNCSSYELVSNPATESKNYYSIAYGICEDTGRSKTVTITNGDFTLREGAILIVRFTNNEILSGGATTLNVNNADGKPITYKTALFSGDIIKDIPYIFIISKNCSSYELVSNPADINQSSSSNNIYESIPYGICEDTGRSKTVTITNGGFTLREGAILIVRFTNNEILSGGATMLNVNNTGELAIYYENKLSQGATIIKDKLYVFMVGEDCSSYEMIYNPADINQSSSSNNIYESIPYGICEDTGRSKTVTITNGDFTLLEGAMLIVRFTNNEILSGGATTLNVNNTGNKPITYKNASFSDAIIKDIPYIFIVSKNCSSYELVSNPATENNTHNTATLHAGNGGASNQQTGNGNTKLTLTDGTTNSKVLVIGDNGISVSSIGGNAEGKIIIENTAELSADNDSDSPSGAKLFLNRYSDYSSDVKIYGAGLSTISRDGTGIKINSPLSININAFKLTDENASTIKNYGNTDTSAITCNYRTSYTFNGGVSTKKTYNRTSDGLSWQNTANSSDVISESDNSNNSITISLNSLGIAVAGHGHNFANYPITNNKLGSITSGFMSGIHELILDNNIHQGRNLATGSDGTLTYPIGRNSIAIGTSNIASADHSCGIGVSNTVSGKNAFAIGHDNIASAGHSCGIGMSNTVSGKNAFAIGHNNNANRVESYLIGYDNTILDSGYSFIFGTDNIISGEVRYGTAIGKSSSIRGSNSTECTAIGGGFSYITNDLVTSTNVYLKGTNTRYTVNGETKNQPLCGHSLAFGQFSQTRASYSVSLGTSCITGDIGSVACGMAPDTGYDKNGTHTGSLGQRNTVYGLPSGTTDANVFIVGNGYYDNTLNNDGTFNHPVEYDTDTGAYIHNFKHSNAFRVTYMGHVYGTGAFNTSGADYAEFIKEWYDGNPDNEDRVGYMVTIGEDGKLHKANEGDYIIGITSGYPAVIGNSDEDYFWKYERDKFNRIIIEEKTITIQEEQPDGSIIDKETIVRNKKINDNYDENKSYTHRYDRPEWDYVGMRGVVPCRDDGTCIARGFCKCSHDGIATRADTRGFDTYYVIERIDDETISVEVK